MNDPGYKLTAEGIYHGKRCMAQWEVFQTADGYFYRFIVASRRQSYGVFGSEDEAREALDAALVERLGEPS